MRTYPTLCGPTLPCADIPHLPVHAYSPCLIKCTNRMKLASGVFIEKALKVYTQMVASTGNFRHKTCTVSELHMLHQLRWHTSKLVIRHLLYNHISQTVSYTGCGIKGTRSVFTYCNRVCIHPTFTCNQPCESA